MASPIHVHVISTLCFWCRLKFFTSTCIKHNERHQNKSCALFLASTYTKSNKLTCVPNAYTVDRRRSPSPPCAGAGTPGAEVYITRRAEGADGPWRGHGANCVMKCDSTSGGATQAGADSGTLQGLGPVTYMMQDAPLDPEPL